MDVMIEDLSEFTPKKVTIAIECQFNQEILTSFLKDALRKGLPGDLDDLFRRILDGLS